MSEDMNMVELPIFTGSSHAHALYHGCTGAVSSTAAVDAAIKRSGGGGGQGVGPIGSPPLQYEPTFNRIKQQEKVMAEKAKLRLVQVFIADTDENLPLANRLLYSGSPTITDSTDQELFYELNVAKLLETHNAKRLNKIDKRFNVAIEKYLEPIRIRDLTMTVVTIASF